MNEQKNTPKKGIHPVIIALLMAVLAPLSAALLAEAHSFVYLFDALSVEARAAFPVISALFLAGFLLIQAALTGLCAELFVQNERSSIISLVTSGLGTACGILISPLCYGGFVAPPFLLVCSFFPAGVMMSRSYRRKDEKKTSILWACGGAGIVLALTLLMAALLYKEGFALYFKDFFARIGQGIERFSADTLTVLVDHYGSQQALFESLTAGMKVDPSVTAEAFLASYKENYAGALTFLVYLAPGILFDLFAVPCYLGYGVLRLTRMAASDRKKRYLNASPVAAVTLALCLIFYAFISMFLGGGLLTVLALNLIVMLTPLLFVPGLKVTYDMMKQLFKRNKLMFIVCGVIILFSPFMVVALSGCYAVFGQMLKSFLEKRGIGS